MFVKDNEVVFSAGDRAAIAPALRRVKSVADGDLGLLEVSVTDASSYANRARDLTQLHTIVVNGKKVLASTLPAADDRVTAGRAGGTITVGGNEYRMRSFADGGSFSGQQIRVLTLGPKATAADASSDRTFAGAILAGFLLLAIACAMLVSRTLQREIAGFLTAARKLAAGDFSAQIPTVGHDEFAELGEEFNKMSRELEGRLGELSKQRGRIQNSMRRLGEAVASNLDRDALLELVVRTAVDGVGADAGRACVRSNGGGTLQERSHVGNTGGLRGRSAVRRDRCAGSATAREASIGDTTAIAHPLRGADGRDEIIGVVSVARMGRPFTASDRDLFSYLAGQVARSMENVELHETTARQSVTDDLTGISNRRAFDDVLSREIERSKRFGSDLGLVLIDLDDFKVVNDTYGHPQGDVVLRAVASVLRESSREIDHPRATAARSLRSSSRGPISRARSTAPSASASRSHSCRSRGSTAAARCGSPPAAASRRRMAPASTGTRCSTLRTARCTKQSAMVRTCPYGRGRLSLDGIAGRRHP